MKLTACILALALAAGLLIWSVVDFVPTCVTFGRIKKLIPAERTCTSHPAFGALLALTALLTASAAVRALSSARGSRP